MNQTPDIHDVTGFVVYSKPQPAEYFLQDNRRAGKEDGNSAGSCFEFRVPACGLWVPVLCNASPFFVMCHFFHSAPTPAPNMLCNVLMHYTKSDALQKTGTRNPQTGARNPKQEPMLNTVLQRRWAKL